MSCGAQQANRASDTPLLPAGTTVQPSASIRNLGVLFDADLSLTVHIN